MTSLLLPPPPSLEVYSGYRDDMMKKRETPRQKKDLRQRSHSPPCNQGCARLRPKNLIDRRWPESFPFLHRSGECQGAN